MFFFYLTRSIASVDTTPGPLREATRETVVTWCATEISYLCKASERKKLNLNRIWDLLRVCVFVVKFAWGPPMGPWWQKGLRLTRYAAGKTSCVRTAPRHPRKYCCFCDKSRGRTMTLHWKRNPNLESCNNKRIKKRKLNSFSHLCVWCQYQPQGGGSYTLSDGYSTASCS